MAEIWDAQWLTNGGPKHAALETALGTYLDAANISLFNNGTIALITACQALRLSGEVITTPFTFAATPHVLSWNNITPVFADIDPVTMNLDPRNIEPLITNRTSAILAVHVFGTPCDVEGMQTIADRHGLKVIYDGAHAFGTTVGGRSVTSFGDATMLSFHATKLFHTAEGGALVVQNSEIKKRVDFLKNFGIQDETTVLMPGINGKMSELHAALGLLTLNMVADERKRRQVIADIYRERLGDRPELVMPPVVEGATLSQQYFAIRVRNSESRVSRDYLFDKLRQYNIYTRKYFYPLCSNYSCYRMLPSAQDHLLPVAQQVAEEVLCLPFYGGLSAQDVHRICDAILFILAA
ncbi:DegT/DnrJ/EryC1/StrS family aminotransferase [Gluconacetobacter takamatsuzukensis]|nr:DegT/DnrJ/EryC1/StrS family aminotransferase [Gluconacetobacter takamatsuzukensis]